MEVTDYIGPLSLVPAAVAVILAFTTRNTVFSLAVACLVGVLVAGEGLLGFPKLLVGALGTESFSWILLLEFFIGKLCKDASGVPASVGAKPNEPTKHSQGTY